MQRALEQDVLCVVNGPCAFRPDAVAVAITTGGAVAVREKEKEKKEKKRWSCDAMVGVANWPTEGASKELIVLKNTLP